MASIPQPEGDAEEECPIKTAPIRRATAAREEISALYSKSKSGLPVDKELRRARTRRAICMVGLRDHIDGHGY